MNIVNGVSYLLVLALLILSIIKYRKAKPASKDNTKNIPDYKDYIIMAMLLVILVVIRVINLGSIPGGINQDGAMAAVDAKALAMYGTDRFGTRLPAHLYAWGYGQMSSLLSYSMVPFIKIFGLNTWTMRMPVLIASILGSVAIFYIVKKVLGKKSAFCVLAFMVVCPWHFMQSRWALDCNLFPHMFVIGLCLLIYGIERRPLLYVSMVFFALCMYAYGVAFYMVPFFLLVVAVVLVAAKKIKVWEMGICVAVYMFIAWPEYLTMFINFAKLDTISLPFVTMQYFKDSVRSNDMLIFSDDFGRQLLLNMKSFWNVVILQKQDLVWNNIGSFGNVFKCTIILGFAGIVISIVKLIKHKDIYSFLLLIYLIFASGVGIFINGINVNRVNIVFYAIVLMAVVTVDFIIKNTGKLSLVLGGMYLVLGILFTGVYFTEWSDVISDAFFDDFVSACRCAREINAEEYRITPDVQYEGSVTVADILVQFVFDIDCKYHEGAVEASGDNYLPFNERFKYGNPYDFYMDDGKDIVYVIKSTDEYAFDEAYEIVRFGKYDVVYSKKARSN